jgi:two-component system response regulator ChvI
LSATRQIPTPLVRGEHGPSILKSEGYNVDTFTDSFQALKHFVKLNRPYYDLVILDIRMPGMNGIQLYQKLKLIDEDLRVIFVTAHDAAKELISILPDLNSHYIVRKPIAARDFIKVVRSINFSGDGI